MADEIVATEVVTTEPAIVGEPVATDVMPTEQPPAEEHVDEPPSAEDLQAEIARLKEVKEKAETDARYWRQQKVEARADYFKSRDRGDQGPKTSEAEIEPEPKLDDFDDFQQYNDAKIAYEVKKARMEWDRSQATKEKETNYQARLQNTIAETLDEGLKKYADFEEVAMDQTIPITPAVVEALADSDIKADVAYYLGKNRAEAIKLSKMTPIQIAREITKIEVEIKNAGPNSPVVSKAPPPIKALGSSHTVEKDPDKMTQKEFEAMREKEGAKPF